MSITRTLDSCEEEILMSKLEGDPGKNAEEDDGLLICATYWGKTQVYISYWL